MHAKRRGDRTRALGAGERVVRDALRRRGLRWDGERDPTPLLVPRAHAPRERHYAMLHHYSYRLFLRDVLKHPDALAPATLARYVSADVAARYLRFLASAGLVSRGRLRDRRIVSFGGTLEWWVAEVLARELGCDVAHGLRIAGATHGGDYDVVACAEGALIYAETKSAPPRQIVQGEVGAFLDRIDTLRPDVALFVVDTTLRMRDKLVPMFAAEVDARGLGWAATRLARETWRVGPEVYLLNAEPDLARSLGCCLAAHFRGRGIAAGRAINAPSSGGARSPTARA